MSLLMSCVCHSGVGICLFVLFLLLSFFSNSACLLLKVSKIHLQCFKSFICVLTECICVREYIMIQLVDGGRRITEAKTLRRCH